jgi:hypothetical protein
VLWKVGGWDGEGGTCVSSRGVNVYMCSRRVSALHILMWAHMRWERVEV